MKLTQPFSVNELPERQNQYDPLPPGWYQARIAQAEVKSTKAKTGEYIAVRYDITGPTHQGRVVFGNLNISNPNAEAERIGREQLGELMRAIGLAQIADTDQLIGGVCEIKVEIRKGDGQYADSNDIKAWKSVSSGGAPKSAASANGALTSAAPPWVKK